MTAASPDDGTAGACTTRAATPSDATAIAAIYNQGIADRVATFETESRSPDDIVAWFTPGRLIMVAEGLAGVVAFAAAFPYSTRPCAAGVK
jgi:phosphinothricin acetyltransferase